MHRKDASAFLTSAVQMGNGLGLVCCGLVSLRAYLWVMVDINLSSNMCMVLEHLH